MGPCLTRQSRVHEMAGVRIIAAIIRQGVNLFCGAGNGADLGDNVSAASLGDFMSTVTLPPKMAGKGLSEAALRQNVSDAIQ